MLLVGAVAAGPAIAADPPDGVGGFDPGLIITDAEMFDGARMNAAAIDQRLAALGSGCVSAGREVPCLKDLKVTMSARSATKYCAAVPARNGVTVGQMIADVAVACRVNPQVIVVMLQKEQSLVTTTEPTQRRLDRALGFRCPDFQECDPTYKGIVNQVYFAASRLQEYGDPSRGFTYQIGSQLVAYSPYAFCGSARIDIKNRATAALYNYTPFTTTQKSLDAGAGVVPHDVCSTYGNRNFYRIYHQWFSSPNGGDPHVMPKAAPLAKAPSAPFSDVPFGSSLFFTEISWMKMKGLTFGYPDGTYRPGEPISREAMAAFLYRAAGSPSFTPPSSPTFTDVTPASTIYWREIEWMSSAGIAKGFPDGTFHPEASVNRDAMAAFLYRAAGSPVVKDGTSPFTDMRDPSTMFRREVAWVSSAGIATGYPDGTYRPTEPISREAMAAFVYRWKV